MCEPSTRDRRNELRTRSTTPRGVSSGLLAGAFMVGVLWAGASYAAAPSDPPVDNRDFDPGVSNLTVCKKGSDEATPEPTGPVDIAEFAKRLHGTWKLDSRTIRGLPIDARARMHMNLDEIGESKATGTALMIDYGNLGVLDPLDRTLACPEDSTVAAFWEVSITKTETGRLELKMDGEYYGSYGDFRNGTTDTELSYYDLFGSHYMSGGLLTPSAGHGPPDLWDRVDLDDGLWVYISCKNGYIERYSKVSDDEPTLDNLPLREAWQKRKAAGSLTIPIPVENIWGGNRLELGR